ncbi:Hypothetical protein CINCED_3A001875 [Cinara cedri]|uniref:Uncharacterized protein n=1 Tax=Cinara cedri TaxID=506608 RepID=A0A5E4MNM5_9HEMI|nr:Hypothetical protein CINCED_3A001875 [Cinara cedri]
MEIEKVLLEGSSYDDQSDEPVFGGGWRTEELNIEEKWTENNFTDLDGVFEVTLLRQTEEGIGCFCFKLLTYLQKLAREDDNASSVTNMNRVIHF